MVLPRGIIPPPPSPFRWRCRGGRGGLVLLVWPLVRSRRPAEGVLSPALFFVGAWLLLALLWRCWGCDGGCPAVVVGAATACTGALSRGSRRCRVGGAAEVGEWSAVEGYGCCEPDWRRLKLGASSADGRPVRRRSGSPEPVATAAHQSLLAWSSSVSGVWRRRRLLRGRSRGERSRPMASG